MKLIVCRWCLGGLLMNPATCPQCEGACTYHITDSCLDGDIVVPCSCKQCFPKAERFKVMEGQGR
jgi:hypothetical protein